MSRGYRRAALLPLDGQHARQDAWKAANQQRELDDKLVPIGLHEGRHTCASTFIAAGANPKVIQKIMGHASITETFDRYGYLFPGGLDEAAAAANASLAASTRNG